MASEFLSKSSRIDEKNFIMDTPGPLMINIKSPNTLPNFTSFSSSQRSTATKQGDSITEHANASICTSSMPMQSLLINPTIPTAAFQSGERFLYSANNETPSPTAYSLKSSFDIKPKTANGYTSRSSNLLAMIQASNPRRNIPTIPNNRNQVYESKDDGSLIPLPNMTPGYTGTICDKVGPLDYKESKVSKPSSSGTIRFNVSGDRKTHFDELIRQASQIPGPGYYNTTSSFDAINNSYPNKETDFAFKLSRARMKGLPGFRSKAKRELPIQQDIPPPGSYNLPSTLKLSDPIPQQSFSSSEPRFKDASLRGKSAPSMGSYNIPSLFDINKREMMKKHSIAMKSDGVSVSFNSTGARFVHNHFDESIPGSIYNPRVNIADNIPKENPRGAHFGTSGERFKHPTELIHKKDNHDTNSAFKIESNLVSKLTIRKKNQKPITGILSSHTKIDIKQLSMGPPPTAYCVQQNWNNAPGVTRMQPPKGNPRVKLIDANPSPMQYNPVKPLGSNFLRNEKLVMISSSKRDIFSIKNDSPPVGSYNVSKSLLIPSHNAMFQSFNE